MSRIEELFIEYEKCQQKILSNLNKGFDVLKILDKTNNILAEIKETNTNQDDLKMYYDKYKISDLESEIRDGFIKHKKTIHEEIKEIEDNKNAFKTYIKPQIKKRIDFDA